ncbi:asparaginase [Alicyclobacillus acidoterrestris]|uniref:asparaginase n=1 Tax=Alicyclobacillus suci TaxID=2816080 RepID=UPI001195A19D|nr:asparaginase [Alicyclobacillus suci]GEO27231.1 asparaginase [Alicyclobacillus acidoterrestris]
MNILVEETRAGVVDNVHLGHIAVVNADGKVLYHYGDPNYMTYGRSALKPMQAIPIIETGAADHFQFEDADLAIFCASHSGEERHRSRVRAILKQIGKDEHDLECGVMAPISKTSNEELIRSGQKADPVCNCCSGVHAGMLATAVYLGEDTHGYVHKDHPVQRRVAQAVANVVGLPVTEIHTGLDGCDIPTYYLPLKHLAWGFARLAQPKGLDESQQNAIVRIVEAMDKRPDMVTEKNIYSAKLIRAFEGRILAKEGAKGVFCLFDRERELGVAVKIADGGAEPIPAVVNEILRQLDIGTNGPLDELTSYDRESIKNIPGHVVGYMEPRFSLSQTSRGV